MLSLSAAASVALQGGGALAGGAKATDVLAGSLLNVAGAAVPILGAGLAVFGVLKAVGLVKQGEQPKPEALDELLRYLPPSAVHELLRAGRADGLRFRDAVAAATSWCALTLRLPRMRKPPRQLAEERLPLINYMRRELGEQELSTRSFLPRLGYTRQSA